MRIPSALGRPARILALLILNFVLMGCQGIAPGGGAEPVPRGTLSVTPASLSFGDVTLGKTASLKSSLKAAGASVIVSSASSSSTEFTIGGISFPVTLNAGQSLSFNVTFTPQASGAANATLTFTSDALDSSSLQSVDGTGAPVPRHSVDLSWNPSQSSGVVGYNVYRGGKPGGPYSRINVVLEASTSYTDLGPIEVGGHYYVVTAVDGNSQESDYSNEAQVVIPAALTPSRITVHRRPRPAKIRTWRPCTHGRSPVAFSPISPLNHRTSPDPKDKPQTMVLGRFRICRSPSEIYVFSRPAVTIVGAGAEPLPLQ